MGSGLVRIEVTIAGDKQLERELLGIGHRAISAAPAFFAIGEFIIGETAEQFRTEGRHASGGWQPLQEDTILDKQRRALRPEILRATDALMKSLTVRGDQNMIFKVDADEFAFGSRLVYAGAHQNPRPTSNLPQRRPVELTHVARIRIVKLLQRFLITGEVVA